MREILVGEKSKDLFSERLAVLKQNPVHGPRILFFSGGSALNPLARYLKLHTVNSVHIVTPFDSGGSSAALRKTFAMPAVGDVRNRLLALADVRNPEIGPVTELLGRRFTTLASRRDLRDELERLAAGIAMGGDVSSDPRLVLVCDALAQFVELVPDTFDLRGASIGNLVLAAHYLRSGRKMSAAISWFSDLIDAQGSVAVSADADLHLATRLSNGQIVFGQHRITGKETEPIAHGIRDIWLTASRAGHRAAQVDCEPKAVEKISQADVICYPPGSFFSSLIANLLPTGIVDAIALNSGPKVFVPNRGKDPECPGWRPDDALQFLLQRLCLSGDVRQPANRVMTDILVDRSDADAFANSDLEKHDIRLRIGDLVSARDGSNYDPEKLGRALLDLSLCRA